MKTNYGILVGVLGAGVAIGWMLPKGASPVAEPAMAATKTARPAEAETLSTKNPRPAASAADESDQPLDTKTDRPEGMPRLLPLGGDQSPQAKEMTANMLRQMEESRTRKIDERVAMLTSRLHLTPDQAAKVRALLEESNPKPTLSPDGGVIRMSQTFGKPGSDEETKIAELLTPEQQEDYTALQKEQRENRMEIAYNREMARIQEQLTLTPEQKDRVYEALGNVLRDEATQPDKNLSPETFEAGKKARVDALRPILTPEQLAVYEATPPTPPFNVSGVSSGEVIGFSASSVVGGAASEATIVIPGPSGSAEKPAP